VKRLLVGLSAALSLTTALLPLATEAQQRWGTATGQTGAPPTGYATGQGMMPAQPFGAPGAIYPGTYYLRNQPGFYYPNPNFPVYPTFGVPQAMPGGLFSMNSGGRQFMFWKAPSGYYYPWARRNFYGVAAPIIIYNQGVSTPSQPPLSTVFDDLGKFLAEAKAGNKLSTADYDHLALRLKDLEGKERSLRISGTLDPDSEADLRKDLDMLGEEMSRRIQ